MNIFDDIFNVLFLYSWPSWQKNRKLPQNNLYTWKSSNRHLYWSSLCKKSDVRYLSSHSLNQELFKRQKNPLPRFFESLDESLKLSSWIIQSYCHQIQKFLNILSLQISSEDYETWITVGRQFFGPSDKVSVICIIETRNTSISTRLYIVELRYTVEIKLKNYVSSFITVDANSCCC